MENQFPFHSAGFESTKKHFQKVSGFSNNKACDKLPLRLRIQLPSATLHLTRPSRASIYTRGRFPRRVPARVGATLNACARTGRRVGAEILTAGDKGCFSRWSELGEAARLSTEHVPHTYMTAAGSSATPRREYYLVVNRREGNIFKITPTGMSL